MARETGQGEDELHFEVQATVPWIGRVVAYRGHLRVPFSGAPGSEALSP